MRSSMIRKYRLPLVLVILVAGLFSIMSSCGGGGGGSGPAPVPNIDVTSGFSTAYLAGKSFYRPESYYSNNFIEVRQFTDSTVSWSDDLFNPGGHSANYSIVSANGINGILTYNDGVYDLYFNVQSVLSDRILVCYKYTGIASVSSCTAAEAQSWYFDRATAEANFP